MFILDLLGGDCSDVQIIIVTVTFCCDNLWKIKLMALERFAKFEEFFSFT